MPTLGDYIKIKHGYAFKGDYITSEDNGIVLVTPGNFEIGGGFKERKCKFFSGNYPNEYVLKPNDLIVSMTDLSKQGDTLGYSARVPKSETKFVKDIFLIRECFAQKRDRSLSKRIDRIEGEICQWCFIWYF